MMRTSQANFLLALALALPLTNFGCSSSSLSGGSGLTGGKKEKEKKEEPEEKEDQGEEKKEEEGTDVPVWVNASYLTCVPEKDKSDDTNVSVLCGLDDESGKAIKPDGTKIAWSAADLDGAETDEDHVNADTEERFQGRFTIAGKDLAKRVITCKFNGNDLEHGKQAKLTDAIKDFSEDSELAKCLAADDAVAKDCVAAADDAQKTSETTLTKVRAFVLSNINTGALGGLDGADLKCANAAQNSSLSGKYKALLSASTRNAIDLLPANLPIVEAVGGAVIAETRAQLFPAIGKAFTKDEDGQAVPESNVWTGSNTQGKKSGHDCKDWTSSETNQLGTYGQTGKVGQDWNYLDAGPTTCFSPARIYCVEVQ